MSKFFCKKSLNFLKLLFCIDLHSRSKESSNSRVRDGDKTAWSGDASRNVGFGFSENRVTIVMDDENSGKVEKKEQPLWMTKSTVDGVATSNSTVLEVPLELCSKYVCKFCFFTLA